MVSVLPISNVVSMDTFLAHVSPTVILPMASILLSLCPSSPSPYIAIPLAVWNPGPALGTALPLGREADLLCSSPRTRRSFI